MMADAEQGRGLFRHIADNGCAEPGDLAGLPEGRGTGRLSVLFGKDATMPPPNLYACVNLVVRLPFPLLCDSKNYEEIINEPN